MTLSREWVEAYPAIAEAFMDWTPERIRKIAERGETPARQCELARLAVARLAVPE